MGANPPERGCNWSSSLEVALRLIAWCWGLQLLRGAAALTPAFFTTLLGWIQAHARHVERYLSQYSSPNTHLAGEALALYYAGTLFPDLLGADAWHTLGRETLVEQMQRQVFPDGVHFEQSTTHQYYIVEMYLQFLVLAEQNSEEVPLWMQERLCKMLDYLVAICRPDRSMPMIGDGDGGWALPLVRRQPGDYGGLFSTAAVLFDSPHYAWAAGALAPETLWLLGAAAEEDWQALRPEAPAAPNSTCFRDGGYVVMRSGWDRRAHHLIFDTGALGCPVSGAHGHADLLSIQCCAFGEPYLVDAGTYCYTANKERRDYFRSSQAHSTLIVDGLSQARPSGPFSWHDRPAARLRSHLSKAGCSIADAEHHAYGTLPAPVIHRRRVAFVDARYWVVVDDLSGASAHHVDLRFQFAALPLVREAAGWVRARGTASALLLKTFSSVALTSAICSGGVDPRSGWLSPNYGQRIAAPALSLSAPVDLPVRFVTLLYPVAEPEAAPPEVRAQFERGELACLCVGSGNKEWIRVAADRISIMRSINEWNL